MFITTLLITGLSSGVALTAPASGQTSSMVQASASDDRTTYVNVARAKKGKTLTPRLNRNKRLIVARGRKIGIPMKGPILSFRAVSGGFLVEMDSVKRNITDHRLYYLPRRGAPKLVSAHIPLFGSDYHVMTGGRGRALVAYTVAPRNYQNPGKTRVVRIANQALIAELPQPSGGRFIDDEVLDFHAGLVWLNRGGSLSTWDLKTGAITALESPRAQYVDAAHGQAVRRHSNGVRQIVYATTKTWPAWRLPREESFVSWSPDGQILVTATGGSTSNDGYWDTIFLRNASSGALIRQFTSKRPGKINANFTTGVSWQGSELVVAGLSHAGRTKAAVLRLGATGKVRRVSAIAGDHHPGVQRLFGFQRGPGHVTTMDLRVRQLGLPA